MQRKCWLFLLKTHWNKSKGKPLIYFDCQNAIYFAHTVNMLQLLLKFCAAFELQNGWSFTKLNKKQFKEVVIKLNPWNYRIVHQLQPLIYNYIWIGESTVQNLFCDCYPRAGHFHILPELRKKGSLGHCIQYLFQQRWNAERIQNLLTSTLNLPYKRLLPTPKISFTDFTNFASLDHLPVNSALVTLDAFKLYTNRHC